MFGMIFASDSRINQLQIDDCRLQIDDCGLQIDNCRLQIVDCGFEIACGKMRS